jgi:hypothetical protein
MFPLLYLGLARRWSGARLKIQARTKFDQIQKAENGHTGRWSYAVKIGGWESAEEGGNNKARLLWVSTRFEGAGAQIYLQLALLEDFCSASAC